MDTIKMQLAAKQPATTDIKIPVTNEVAAKRLLRKTGLQILGTVAAVAAVIVIADKVDNHISAED